MSLVLCILSRAPAEYIDGSLSIHLAFPLFAVEVYINKLSKRENWLLHIKYGCVARFFFFFFNSH